MTDAHDQRTSIHLLCHYPEHDPRASDSHYRIFNQSKRRIKKLGLWKCAMPGPHSDQLELHHDKIEFSMQGGVDLQRFNELYGLHLATDAEFKGYIESPGALEVLCSLHHRSHLGVHSLPTPFWQALRVWKDGILPPAEVE